MRVNSSSCTKDGMIPLRVFPGKKEKSQKPMQADCKE